MTIETYPEMNDKIIELLRICSDDPSLLYAAQRIEELEAEIRRLRASLEEILDEATSDLNRDIIITECQSALLPAPDACLCLTASVLAQAGYGRQALPCGHPREAATGDVTRWCTIYEEESQE